MPISKLLRDEIIKAEDSPTYDLFAGDLLLPEDQLLYYRLANNVRRYTSLEDDPHISAVMDKRRMAVVAREWRVDPAGEKPADKAAAEMCTEVFKGFNFDEACSNLLNALLLGRFMSEIMWSDGETGGKAAIVVKEINGKDPSRLVFGVPDDETKTQHIKGFQANMLSRYSPWLGEPLPLNKIIIHTYGSKIGNPYGYGLGSKLYWMQKFKKECLKFWMVFLDKFSQPTPVGYYSEGQDKRELEGFLKRISRGVWAALPEGYRIDFMQVQSAGTLNSYESFADWCDGQISKAVLGETLSTQAQAVGGSNAATQTHNDVRKEVCKADSDLLSETLRAMLLRPLVQFNMPGAKVPNVYRVFEELEDLNGRVVRDKTLFDIGYRLKPAKVLEIYGEGYEDIQEETPDAPAFAEVEECGWSRNRNAAGNAVFVP
jgi:phage gp29-like protein